MFRRGVLFVRPFPVQSLTSYSKHASSVEFSRELRTPEAFAAYTTQNKFRTGVALPRQWRGRVVQRRSRRKIPRQEERKH